MLTKLLQLQEQKKSISKNFLIFEGTSITSLINWLLMKKRVVLFDKYIPYCKYQLNPLSSPWFSAALAGAMAHFFFIPTE